MFDINNIYSLDSYVHSLEDLSEQLEKAYFENDLQKAEMIKKMIIEIKKNIDAILI